MHNPYRWARLHAFRDLYKLDFYAWAYGNYYARLLHDDVYSMYNMGKEL
jgi:hypothetical protein